MSPLNKNKKKKTLLLTAAVAAASASSSMALVYSINTVGYTVFTTGSNKFDMFANPLDNTQNGSNLNTLNGLLPALPNKSSAQLWNGVTYVFAGKAGSPSVWTPNLPVPLGTGFFLKTPSAQPITFVGNVISSNAPYGTSITNPLPTTLQLVGSQVPYSSPNVTNTLIPGVTNGMYLNDTNFGLGVLPNKSSIQVWSSPAQTFVFAGKAGTPSVWTPTNLVIGIGYGFFVQSKVATNWVQTYHP